ncbi:hypothetical protein P154DRAFT_615160 [Amniculicola lignicola CBS 123094]|uniref:Ribonuclease H2 subunit B n=1 Tax=Amniculicola lignicola CBS 123094 TaxID=1392246 RepID=A0A6A5WZF4_9PLEO|nr:hypothetical protein P154DRAFT_615160 [Amniculicola lignicola CBS 123094]
MARTRSKPATKAKASTPGTAESATKAFPASVENPPKLFVLPKDTSKDARIVTLENPATGMPSRYFFCPDRGFYEFTRIAAPKRESRSWLITSEKRLDDAEKKTDAEEEKNKKKKKEEEEEAEEEEAPGGYITKSSDLFIATPIDMLFLILPALAPKSAKDTKQLFLCLDDHMDKLSSSSPHLKVLLSQYPSIRTMLSKRLTACCDIVDAGDETMFRLSHAKLLSLLLTKASRMCAKGLPPSLEEKFIKTALSVPIMTIAREESNLSTMSTSTTTTKTTTITDNSQASTTPSTTFDSQSSTATTSTTATNISTEEIQEKPSLETPPEIPHLLRLRTALTYLLTTYLPSPLRAPLQTLLTSTPTHDFASLDAHLATLTKLKSEAFALRSISDNISRKRGFEEGDEERMAEREEKKRKKEDEEKRKKAESRGVKQLRKVDTSGMKKLSSFFGKPAVKKT